MDSRAFFGPVVTPEGTPLGGSVDLLVNQDGTYSATFTMHSSSFAGSFDFRVMATLGAVAAPSLLFLHGGHVSGVNSDVHVENGHLPQLATYWSAFADSSASFQVGKDYHWGGVVGTFNDLVKDVITLGGGALGATLGLVIGATHEATDWMGLDLGPGGTLGVIAGLAVFEVGLVEGLGSAGSFVAGTVAGVATGAVANELIDYRPLSDTEKALARRVFADTLNLDRVRVTNFEGLGGRAFTAPGVDGLIYCNLGAGFDGPGTATSSPYPAPGELLIHELVHAWQICHSSSWPAMMCSGIINQTEKRFGDDVYAYGPAGPDWGDLNAEQQAALVDQWFGGSGNSAGYRPMSRSNPYYRYLLDDVRGGRHIPDMQVAAIHPRTDEGAVSLYTVGDDGHVWSNFWPTAGAPQWSGWFQVGTQTFPAGASVSVVRASAVEGATSLFVTDQYGAVWTNSWPAPNTEAGLASGHIHEWVGWQPVGPSKFPAGAPISALHNRPDEGAVTLFGVGSDGRVWSAFWPQPNTEASLRQWHIGGWSDWYHVGENTFPPGSPITAAQTRTLLDGSVSLYVVGVDGKVWSAYWPTPDPGTPSWSGWFPIGEHTFRLASQVTALHPRADEGSVALFAVEANTAAQVQLATWPATAGSTAWSSWQGVAPDMFPTGAIVSALHSRTQDGEAALFTMGLDGRVWTNFGTVGAPGNASTWGGWAAIGDSTFPATSTVTALHPRTDEGATSLYVIDHTGHVQTTYWPAGPDTPNWAPWYTLGDNTFPT